MTRDAPVADRHGRRSPQAGSITIPVTRPSLGRMVHLGALTGVHVARSVAFSWRRRGVAGAAVAGAGRAVTSSGPTLVKLGQMVSANPAIFPPAVTAAFRRCQDRVPPERYETVRWVVETEFDRPLESLYSWMEPTPIASASIAQVHRARLPDGTPVAVKVQRPHLRRLMSIDLSLLSLAARSLVLVRPRYAAANPQGVIEDFRATLSEELSFIVEAASMERMRSVLEGWPVVIPKTHPELTSRRVLTMELVEGTRIDDVERLVERGHDPERLADLLISSLLRAALHRGVFHGDGHPGNLAVLDDGRLALYDFGIVGELADDDRRAVSRFFRGLIVGDFTVMTEELTTLADLSRADLGAAARDIAGLQEGLLTDEGQIRLTGIDHGQLLSWFLDIANRHGMVIPTDLVLLFRQLLYLNGLANVLDPALDVFDGDRFFPFFAPDDGWAERDTP